MYIGNVLLLVLNIPSGAACSRRFCACPITFSIRSFSVSPMVGVYSVNNSLFDVWVMGLFGLLGYLMRKLDFPAAALILGMVLGDVLERALRQSLMMSQGDLAILVTRPISATLLFIAVVLIVSAGDSPSARLAGRGY